MSLEELAKSQYKANVQQQTTKDIFNINFRKINALLFHELTTVIGAHKTTTENKELLWDSSIPTVLTVPILQVAREGGKISRRQPVLLKTKAVNKMKFPLSRIIYQSNLG